MNLTDPIAAVPGIGESYTKRLLKLNIITVNDLLDHFPRTHLDYSHPIQITKVLPGEPVCLKATLLEFISIRTRGRLTIQKAKIADLTGTIDITWFNQPYLKDALKTGTDYYFTGIVDSFNNKLSLNGPDFEPVKLIQVHTKRIIPIYPLTAGITQKWLRHKIYLALQSIKVPEIVTLPDFLTLDQAYRSIHFPKNQQMLKKAKERLAFDDLLAIRLKVELTKLEWRSHHSPSINLDKKLNQKLIKSLPFKLTPDQKTAISNIFSDLNQTEPMNRLLQGDVGSGKTIVAVAAALQVHNNNLSVVIMAPTQVLAEQHFLSFTRFLKPFNIKPILLTSSTTKNLAQISAGHKLFIGTHALLHQPELVNQNIGLLVVDEQHRFGVLQRTHFLRQKNLPHTLTMSATPIPRTIALSLYGHLKISNIITKPKDRQQIKTWVVPETKRPSAYNWLKTEVKAGRQAFIVCPLIEESEHETLKNVSSAKKEFGKLQSIFPELKLALLHGKLKPEEKSKILKGFKNKKADILVSTPVIEVGIDIPNATIILIEGSERFGLASLHQLRGRVGRGEHQSYCLLFNSKAESVSRLKLLENHHNGLDLARLDLKIRGAGEIFGTSQSGHLDTQFQEFWYPSLHAKARSTAKAIVKNQTTAHQILEQLNPSLAKIVSAN